eukprot:4519508-Prymnesium_polylepis.1
MPVARGRADGSRNPTCDVAWASGRKRNHDDRWSMAENPVGDRCNAPGVPLGRPDLTPQPWGGAAPKPPDHVRSRWGGYSVRLRKRMGGTCGHVEVSWRRQTDRPTDHAPHARAPDAPRTPQMSVPAV